MISIIKNLTLTDNSGNPLAPSQFPITYSWVAESGCVTFDVQTGLSYDGTITTTVYFEDESCIENTEVSISVTPNGGCNRLIPISFGNPCTSFTIGSINHTYPYTYVIIPSGGVPGYTYQWSYNTAIFSQTSSTSAPTHGAIVLSLNTDYPGFPTTTTINVLVTDSNGCTRSRSFSQQINGPDSPNITAIAQYSLTRELSKTFELKGLTLPVVAGFSSIDWSTLSIVTPLNVTYDYPYGEGVPNSTPGVINLYFASSLANTTQTISYTVKDVVGISSNSADITVTIPTIPLVVNPPLSQYRVAMISADSAIGDEFEVKLEEVISPLTNIDWNTFDVTNTPASGTTTYDAGNRKLIYEITDLGNPVDKVDWTIEDFDGNRTNKGTLYINFEIDDAPVAVNNSICAVCGGNSGLIDVTANDTGVIDRRTVSIVTYPSSSAGGVSVDANGYVIFNALSTYNGSASFGYKVANWDNQYSNTATVSVTVICAGRQPTDSFDITCYDDLSFNLKDLVGGNVSTGTSWTETGAGDPYTTEGGTITGGYLGTVNFTGHAAGTYSFTGTVTSGSCSHSVTVDIVINSIPYVGNNFCSGAYTIAYPTTTSSSSSIANQDTAGDCPNYKAATESAITASPSTPEQIPTSWNTTRGGDVWFKITVGGTSPTACDIVIDGSSYGTTAGIKNPMAALYTSGGSPCAINDFSLFDDAAQLSGSQTLTFSVTGLTVSTDYWLRVSSGGTANAGKFDITILT